MSNDTFLLCIDNRGYGASLEQRKVYRAMSDPMAEKHAMVRVVDESSEDYLFPAKLFVPIAVPRAAAKAFRAPHRPLPVQPRRRRLSTGAEPPTRSSTGVSACGGGGTRSSTAKASAEGPVRAAGSKAEPSPVLREPGGYFLLARVRM